MIIRQVRRRAARPRGGERRRGIPRVARASRSARSSPAPFRVPVARVPSPIPRARNSRGSRRRGSPEMGYVERGSSASRPPPHHRCNPRSTIRGDAGFSAAARPSSRPGRASSRLRRLQPHARDGGAPPGVERVALRRAHRPARSGARAASAAATLVGRGERAAAEPGEVGRAERRRLGDHRPLDRQRRAGRRGTASPSR